MLSIAKSRVVTTAWLVALLTVALTSGVLAEGWSQWRGPERDGTADVFEVPATWPEEPRQLWKVEVGEGYTSPVLSDGRIYLMARQGDDEVAMALSLEDGKTLWQHSFPTPYTMHQAATKHGMGPKSTPIVADGVACFLGIDGRFSCHDADDGKLLWIKDFSDRTSEKGTFCGSSMSPLVYDGAVFVHLGDDSGGRLMAADLKSGKERWGWEGQGPGYASPILAEIDGQTTFIAFATTHLLGFDPAGGELLWQHPFPDKWKENVVTPIIIDRHLIISDYENGTLAVWPKRTDDGWEVETKWHNKELIQHMTSPVTDGKLFYGLARLNKGQLFALDPQSGEVMRKNPGRSGAYVALTLAGKWLLMSNLDGELQVIAKDSADFAAVKTYEIAQSSVWSHPAWLSDGLLVKDHAHLTRIALAVEAKEETQETPKAESNATVSKAADSTEKQGPNSPSS